MTNYCEADINKISVKQKDNISNCITMNVMAKY